MASPTVRSGPTESQNSGSLNVPSTGRTDGDLLVVVSAGQSAAAVPSGSGLSFTQVANVNNGTGQYLRVHWAIWNTGDATSLTMTGGSGEYQQHAFLVTGHDATTPIVANTTATSVDPPASGSYSLADVTVIAVVADAAKNQSWTDPTNYTEIVDQTTNNDGPAANTTCSSAQRSLTNSTSEDPGAFSGSANSPVSATIVITAPVLSTSVAEVSLASATDPQDDNGHSIKFRARVQSGSGALYAALYEGTNNRSGDLSQVLTTSLADYELPISSANAANISSYANLGIRFWGESAGAVTFEVDYIGLSLPAAESTGATGTIAVTAGAATASITGALAPTGTISVTAGTATSSASATALNPVSGSVSVTSSAASASAQAAEAFSASLAASAGAAEASLSGWAEVSGAVVATATAATSSTTAAEVFAATADVATGTASASIVADHDYVYNATVSATTGAATSAGQAIESYPATIGASAGAASASLDATYTPQAVTGTAELTAGAATASIQSAVANNVATIAVTAGAATASATGTEAFAGSVDATAGPAASASTAAMVLVGAVDATAGAAAATIAADLLFVGVVAVTTGAAAASADGSTSAAAVSGTADLTAGAASAASTGVEAFLAAVATTASAATTSAAGWAEITGTMPVSATGASATASAAESFTGSVTVTAAATTSSSTGWAEITSLSVALTGPAATTTISSVELVYIRPDADLAAGDWGVTPLWSKVDEKDADGVVITETT